MKRGIICVAVFFLMIFVFSLAVISAADTDNEELTGQENQAALEDAYNCVKDKISSDCSTLTIEQQAFAILALGDYKNCEETFISGKHKTLDCWPAANCKLKTTSLALFVYGLLGKDTSKIEEWLLSQTKTASDLIWILQIDSAEAATCTITYGSSNYEINILENKKISSSAGSCLPLYDNSYWLKVSSDCIDKEFKISCDKDFKTNLLYKTENSQTIHVSQIIHSEAAEGQTTEKITYKCFKEGGCDYEGSLWAAMALDNKGQDISSFIPYLEAGVEDNFELFPESFLYILGFDDYLTAIVSDNFKGSYWTASTASKKFYDTALGILAVRDDELELVDKAKEYLLSGVQNSEGCWNNVLETGFLLWAGWGTTNGGSGDECETDAGCPSDEICNENGVCIIIEDDDCEAHGNFCESSHDCQEVGGEERNNFQCYSSAMKICCSKDVISPSCSSQRGEICKGEEECDGDVLDSSDDGVCCDGTCVEKQLECETDDECEDDETCNYDGECVEKSISAPECTRDDECDEGEICKAEKCIAESSSKLIWIVLLIVLIALAVVAIIFRDRLSFLLFKRKFKTGQGDKQTRPPTFPPSYTTPMHRPIAPRMPQKIRPLSSRQSSDKDLDEAMKKLKELSK